VPRARALLVGLEGMTGDIVGRLLKAEPGCEVVDGILSVRNCWMRSASTGRASWWWD